MMRFVDMTQVWLSQLRWVSALGYSFEGYVTAEFRGASVSCAGGLPAEVVAALPALLPNTAAVGSPAVRNALLRPGASCAIDLDEVLAYFSASRPPAAVVGVLCAYLAGLHGLTLLAYRRLAAREAR